MNNERLKAKIISKYGRYKTILFSEMVSYMFMCLHEDLVGMNNTEKFDEFDYGYDTWWWKNTHISLKNELRKRKVIKCDKITENIRKHEESR